MNKRQRLDEEYLYRDLLDNIEKGLEDVDIRGNYIPTDEELDELERTRSLISEVSSWY